ncbi:MAG: hypothetical protein MOB07_09955 [Acidobacteria bacterium]|nr:hypothetical protein [Acidobacteriota bacterium]
MKKQSINAFVFLILFTLAAASAYGQDIIISKVKIPFDFSVRDKTLPAGTYSVKSMVEGNGMLLIRGVDRRGGVVSSTMPVQETESKKLPRLVFRRYGKTYFLFQIWEPSSDQGRQFFKSRTERSVERDFMKRGVDSSGKAIVVLIQ